MTARPTIDCALHGLFYLQRLESDIIARDFAVKFYRSKAWRNCRESYAASVGYLCEECLKSGICNVGEIVHHKIELTPENIDSPTVTLSFDNLMLVCRDCHAKKHTKSKRYYFDTYGNVIGYPPCQIKNY